MSRILPSLVVSVMALVDQGALSARGREINRKNASTYQKREENGSIHCVLLSGQDIMGHGLNPKRTVP
jgi:hypothetical protein